MRFKYFVIFLMGLAACSQPPREIPQWNMGDPSEEPAQTPSADPSAEPSAEPSQNPQPPQREYPETDRVTLTSCTADDCGISAVYTLDDAAGYAYGLYWTNGSQEYRQAGPAEKDGRIFQLIPAALLNHDDTWSVRVYLSKDGEEVFSPAREVTLLPAPEPIQLEWKRLTKGVLPEAIQLYETTSPVNGRNFHAWYAVADLSAVDVKVNVPTEAQTIEDQAAANKKCIVLINGGYFYNGRHTGLAVVDGRQTGSVPSVRGSLRSGDPEYNEMYTVTRGLFGVDAAGKPAVCWAGSANSQSWYYDRPLPSVRGENKYGPVSTVSPDVPLNWTPVQALSAGPVLLKNGQILVNFNETDKGTEYYLNNVEIMPYDIYGPGSICDRTAVGCLEDGRVVFFICDGRISDSPGLNLQELARVLLGIGCTDAVNFDGGGSTGMMVGTLHIGDQTAEKSRKVVSTIGFYRK